METISWNFAQKEVVNMMELSMYEPIKSHNDD